ncbi:type 4a pilus biogenesis protein PilO [Thermodesulfobacteriota bacterium]
MGLFRIFRKYDINRNLILFALTMAALCFLFTDMSYNKKKARVIAEEQQIEALKVIISKLGEAGGDVDEKSANLEKLSAEFSELKRAQQILVKKFPNKIEASKMLEEVVTKKTLNGLAFDLFIPSDEVPTENGYNSIPIEMRLTGNFKKLGEYIKYIEHLPRIFIIDNIAFSVATENTASKSSSATLNGRTFVLNY